MNQNERWPWPGLHGYNWDGEKPTNSSGIFKAELLDLSDQFKVSSE